MILLFVKAGREVLNPLGCFAGDGETVVPQYFDSGHVVK